MILPENKRRNIEVALLAEGVDRNVEAEGLGYQLVESPSSRRAWIEIPPA